MSKSEATTSEYLVNYIYMWDTAEFHPHSPKHCHPYLTKFMRNLWELETSF